ncbi:2-dehydro-3-deoxygalactonokinase [Fuscibacter oryzae]|uniref:2-dehydro-3-deoxygalactonokinase n=1 Tax=Fuscibacter oryzae TaxID=2803939 RepID=A0A8J7N075_9RHOB|nr:2-dehydro-3-deoxygalactonokinase [Fuscibacter oryzae]MBL4930134.1 2-dehydro-3-deoxygalactonokinase [Fuscibacter oryzae]
MMPDWIAVDWGTSNLRVWAMGPQGVLAEAQSDDGMGKLAQDGFEPALRRLIAPWLAAGGVPVVACGMVGARQGWQEAPYRAVPCAPVARGEGIAVSANGLNIRIIPGLCQGKPADVMRGEETQIAGVLALHPQFDGVICLPGTHSKWAHVSAGEVVSFQTYMTGEMFALLSGQSVLRHSMAGNGWDEAAFDAGAAEGLSRPERMMARLFSLRAEGLLAGLEPSAARARLSGLLIGAELAAARPYWLGQRVVLVGGAALQASYARALATQGVTAETLDATACTLAGLAAARP